jgi:hypothetical protein
VQKTVVHIKAAWKKSALKACINDIHGYEGRSTS